MNVSVTDLSTNQKKLQVEIPAQEVREEFEKRYRDLAKNARIKGFRPGKVPRSILKSYYGKTLENEISSNFVQRTFPEALREADLKPLAEADVEEMNFADDGAFTYSAVVDVCPAFELEGYKGLNIRRPAVDITREKIEAELERVRQQHAQLRTLEEERPIREGDVALVDFTPWVEGSVFEKGKTNDHMLEIGKKALHPEFDQHLIGHRSGETLSFDLDYPQDAQTSEIAGKRVHFDVTIKEIKEKIIPELNDEFAQEAGQLETLESLKEQIRKQLEEREQEKAREIVRQQIVDQMLTKGQFELSQKVVEREVDRLVGMLQRQFESQGLKVDTSRFNTTEIRSEYRTQADRNVRWRLISERIAEQEDVQLAREELDDIYLQIAGILRMDVEKLKDEYSESAIVEQAKESRLQDKVFKLLEQEAVYTEASEEANDTNQE